MTRKRIRHEQIDDESKRNAAFEKRADGFCKKANDLSILCGVDVGIVVHKQSGQNNAILWPSPPIFRERLHKFFDFSYMERSKKMVVHEKYMEETIEFENGILSNSRKRIEEKESRQVLVDVTQGKHELDLYKLNHLNSLANEMLKKLGERDDELTTEQQ